MTDTVHPIFQPALAAARGCAEPRSAMVRVVDERGETIGIFDREHFIAHNLDGLAESDVAGIRAGKAVRIGGGAAPIVDIEPVAP